jgi:hypothetical protein
MDFVEFLTTWFSFKNVFLMKFFLKSKVSKNLRKRFKYSVQTFAIEFKTFA